MGSTIPAEWRADSEDEEEGGDHSMDALRWPILDALIQSGQFTPQMLETLRGPGCLPDH